LAITPPPEKCEKKSSAAQKSSGWGGRNSRRPTGDQVYLKVVGWGWFYLSTVLSAGFGVATAAAAILAVATKAVIALRMTSSKILQNRSPEHLRIDGRFEPYRGRPRRQSSREQPEYDRDDQGGGRGSENEDSSTLISIHK
jgi:hypothetical protein